MTDIIILPGIGGSGPDHWQSLWQAEDPRMSRFEPSDWNRPDLADWLAALSRAIAEAPRPPVLLAHSLACLLVPHWAAAGGAGIAGALLVAPPDPASSPFPDEAAGFAPVPLRPLPFPARVAISANDPFGSLDYGRNFAFSLGAELVEIGALGHVNAASGVGRWPQGRTLLSDFLAGLGNTRP
ncbi:alpha/beta hydrolase [Thioclava sp. GXIMD4216]|uniref:RBBP9/YdeN family alpha/beta hydrolase n=1 Tax=unclassified Thioclava TaxID=2621713 RepID=UPI0030CD13E9